jgi:K+-sensing histidine kinase KdpD
MAASIAGKAPLELVKTPREHAEERFQKTGYTIDEVLREWDILRRSIFEVLETEAHLLGPERDAILNLIGRAIAESGAEYNRAQLTKEQMHQARLKASSRRLKELQEVTESALTHSMSLDALLFSVLSHIRTIFECDTVAILLLVEGTDRMVVRAAYGLEEEISQKVEVPKGKGVAGKILASGKAMVVPDLTDIEVASPIIKARGVRSLMGVPLRVGDQSLGVMHVGSLKSRSFESDEVSLLQIIGDRIAIAIENARLVDELKAKLNRLNIEREFRERLVSTITHDLRTPLTAAKTSAQLILRFPDKRERLEASSARIIHSLDRADRMIQDLLDSHRVQAGQPLSLRIEPCDLKEVVERSIEELSAVYGSRFKCNMDSEVRGYWSGADLNRVIENLVTNALKYGDPTAPITINLHASPEEVTLTVHNHNLSDPISPEDQVALFHPFSRTQSAIKGERKGWGLGLSICRGIVEAHCGKIRVESTRETGTQFVVKLPWDSRPCKPVSTQGG